MNLRQKYKKAKKELELLKSINVPTKEIKLNYSDRDIQTFRVRREITPDVETWQLNKIKEQMLETLYGHVVDNYTIFKTDVDPYSGNPVLYASITIIEKGEFNL